MIWRVNMHDELLGDFTLVKKRHGNYYEKKYYNWLGLPIILKFFDNVKDSNKRNLAILHELCKNQEYWNKVMLQYLDENKEKHQLEQSKLRLLEISIMDDEEDIDFYFFYTDGESCLSVAIVGGNLKDGPTTLDGDLYYRGEEMDNFFPDLETHKLFLGVPQFNEKGVLIGYIK